MRLTVIPVDGAVYIDGVSYAGLDLSSCGIPENVHALQWYETFGELEFKRSFADGQFVHPQNEALVELPVWVSACVAKWNEAKVAEEEAHAAALLAAEQNPTQTTGTQEL